VLVTEELTSTKEVFGKIFDQAKEKIKNQIQRDKVKSVESLPSSSSSSSSSTKTSPAPIATFNDLDDFNIDEDNTDSSNNKSETSLIK
jgi:hypothetical protein